MNEVAARNIKSRDRATRKFYVVGYICDTSVRHLISAKHNLGLYKNLWSGVYRAELINPIGGGWYVELHGDFESEAAAIAAFEKLRDAIDAMDEQQSQKSD